MNGFKPLFRAVSTEAFVIFPGSSHPKYTGIVSIMCNLPSLAWARIKASALQKGALLQVYRDPWSFRHGRWRGSRPVQQCRGKTAGHAAQNGRGICGMGCGICEACRQGSCPENVCQLQDLLLTLPLGGRAEQKAQVSPILHSPGHREQG